MTAHPVVPNVLILRSFGKFYGLPGLRLGAVIARTEILDRLSDLLGHWAVSGKALEAGTIAYRDSDWRNGMLPRLRQGQTILEQILTAADYSPQGEVPLFRLIEETDALQLWRHLMTKGIYVRRFEHYENFLRIGLPATVLEAERLASALEQWRRL